MKFPVFLLAVITAQCMASKSWEAADSYLDDISYISGWASYLKRISIISLTLSFVVLYYIPESRTYARRGCHVLIDLVADGLKSILSGADSDNTNGYEEEYERLEKRRRCKPDATVEDEITLSRSILVEEEYPSERHGRKKHREHSKRVRDDKHRHHHRHHQRHRNSAKISMKEPYLIVRSSLSPPLCFYPDQSTNMPKYSNAGFYYPVAEESDTSTLGPSDNYVPFVVSSQEPTMIDRKYKKNNVIVTNDVHHRSRVKRRSRNDVTLYSGNVGSTRDHDCYIPTDTREEPCEYNEVGLKKEFGVKNLSFFEHEPASDTSQQLHDDDSNLDNSITVADGNLNDDRTVVYEKGVPRRKEDSADEDEDSDVKITRERQVRIDYPVSEEISVCRSKQQALKVREIDYKRKDSGNHRKRREISNDKNNRSNGTEVLSQLGDQILKLDHTIRTMRPSPGRRRRVCEDENDYALRTVESILKDIKRGFREYDDRIKGRRRSQISRSISRKKREKRLTAYCENQIDDNLQRGGKLTGKRDLDVKPERENRDVDLSELRNDADLDPEDRNDVPLTTNRTKPVLLRTIQWLFGSCPNLENVKRKNIVVGNEDIHRTFDEWLP